MPGLLRDIGQLYSWIQDPDKAKRDAAQQYLLANPDQYQKLVDSHLSDNPQLLQQLIGRDARFGSNSNASSNLANAISSSPLSEPEQAKRTQDVENTPLNDIANASKQLPQMRAFNGQSNDQFSNNLPGLTSAMTVGPTSLSQNQQDILAKKQGVQTSYEAKTRDLENLERSASVLAATSQAKESTARTSDLTAQTQIKNNQLQSEAAAKSTVEDYYKQFPQQRTKSVYDLVNDKYTPANVVNALFINPDTSESLKSQVAQRSEKARIGVEQDRLAFDKEQAGKWHQRLLESNAIESMSKYGGTKQGYMDLFSGQNTPDSQQAANNLNGASPKDKDYLRQEYQSKLTDLLRLQSSKSVQPDDIKAGLAGLNILGTRLNSMGINTPQLKYDISTTRTGPQQFFQGLPGTSKTRSIQTVDGTSPTMPKYDPSTDQGLIQRKRDLAVKIKKENPNMSDAQLQATVEAQINKIR